MPTFKKVSTGGGTTWDWNTQKTIEGVYMGHKDLVGPFGAFTLYQVETADHTVLDVKVKAQIKSGFAQCQPGAVVRITFMGKGVTKKGQPVNNFTFEIAE